MSPGQLRGGAAAQGDSSAQSALKAQHAGFTTATTAPAAKPTNKLSNYEVYSKYLFFSIGADSNLINYNMYMDICPAKAKWSKAKTWKFSSYVQTYTVKGLKPNTKYKARLYYGLSDTVKGPYSKTVTFQTGPNSKPAVKSTSAKAINVKKRYQKRYGYYTGLYLGKVPYYTYKIRTTVTLKKAPKAKYLVVNGKWFKVKKGKKTYTFTTNKLVRYYTSPKGRQSYKVTVYTAQNKTWKGYSLYYQKTRKV